jgi:protein required for attachment to host cells
VVLGGRNADPELHGQQEISSLAAAKKPAPVAGFFAREAQAIEPNMPGRRQRSHARLNEEDMANTWIVSANASRARFFSQSAANAPLQEFEDMVNEAVRQRSVEIFETDKIGPTSGTSSTHNTGGQVPNKLYEPPQSPEKHQAELFARDIASYLQRCHQEGRFDQLCLVISPKFLGVLRKLLGPEVAAKVKLELDKDYTGFAGKDLLDQINAQRH